MMKLLSFLILYYFIEYDRAQITTKNADWSSFIVNLNEIKATNKRILSLDGIEIYSNLTKIDLSVNGIKTIVQLNALIKLKILNLLKNRINNIDTIARLINLEDINISNNQQVFIPKELI